MCRGKEGTVLPLVQTECSGCGVPVCSIDAARLLSACLLAGASLAEGGPVSMPCQARNLAAKETTLSLTPVASEYANELPDAQKCESGYLQRGKFTGAEGPGWDLG